MEILVAVLVIALIAAVAFVVIARRPGGVAALRRPRAAGAAAPSVRTRRPRNAAADPMTAAVVEHAAVTDPAEVPAAEQRLRAQAQQVAAPLQAEANSAEARRAADPGGTFVDPDERAYGDRYDPRYDASG